MPEMTCQLEWDGGAAAAQQRARRHTAVLGLSERDGTWPFWGSRLSGERRKCRNSLFGLVPQQREQGTVVGDGDAYRGDHRARVAPTC